MAAKKITGETSEIEDAVWFYYKQGFSIIPLGKNKGFWNNKKDDLKKPSLKTWDRYKDTRATKEEIQQWIKEGLFKNIGVVCGHVSNDLVIIDIDDETIPEILGLKGEKILGSGSWFAKTGRGYQFWLKHHSNPGGIKRPLKYKIEYRANNGYCVAPPSIHPNSKRYHFIGIGGLSELPTLVEKDVKSIFNDFKKKIGEKWNIKETKHTSIGSTKTGQGEYPKCIEIALETLIKHPMRYNTIYGIASSFALQGIPKDMALKRIKQFNMEKCSPPKAMIDVENAVLGAYEKSSKKYGCEFWMDDAGLCPYEDITECTYGKRKAKRELLREYRVFIYKEGKNKETGETFYVISGVNCPRLAKLLMNGDGEIYLTMKDNQDVFRYNGKTYEEASNSFIEGRINFYLDDETTDHRKNEVIGFMKGENLVDREKLDGDKNLLPLENGIYDLEKKTLIEYSPDYFFTHYLPVNYNPSAKIDKIKTFFEEIFPLNYIPVVKQTFGDCLLTDYRYKKATLCAGKKHTGKTTFLNLIGAFLGEENTAHKSLYALCVEKYATADLYHKRANICAQTEAASITKVNLFLMLTGNDKIDARRIYQSPFNFVNFAKLIFACNDIPTTNVAGNIAEAYYVRWSILPFEHIFEGDDKDVNMLDKLTVPEEMSGLLNWALEGIESLEENNGYFEIMNYNETKEFMERGTNPLREFADKYISTSSGREWVTDLYKWYVAFCTDNGYPFVNDSWFSRKTFPLLPMSVTKGHTGEKRYWDGITCNFLSDENRRQKTL